MHETSTLARPYASAAYQVATQDNQISEWSEMLELLETITSDKQLVDLINDPRIEAQQLATLINEVAADGFTDKMQNLVKVLADNNRLSIAGDLSEGYETLKAASEQRQTVDVISAFEVTDELQASIKKAMSEQLGCEVELITSIDKDLIGGAVIRAGDTVIDVSVKGRLKQLASALV